jgi:threonyl-tRNA synthetase
LLHLERLEQFLKKHKRKLLHEQSGYSAYWTKANVYVTSGIIMLKLLYSFQPISTPSGEEFLLKPMNCYPHHCEITIK